MIILACDSCGQQSPNEAGENIADLWVTLTAQTQAQRYKKHNPRQTLLCRECFPLLGTEAFTLNDLL